MSEIGKRLVIAMVVVVILNALTVVIYSVVKRWRFYVFYYQEGVVTKKRNEDLLNDFVPHTILPLMASILPMLVMFELKPVLLFGDPLLTIVVLVLVALAIISAVLTLTVRLLTWLLYRRMVRKCSVEELMERISLYECVGKDRYEEKYMEEHEEELERRKRDLKSSQQQLAEWTRIMKEDKEWLAGDLYGLIMPRAMAAESEQDGIEACLGFWEISSGCLDSYREAMNGIESCQQVISENEEQICGLERVMNAFRQSLEIEKERF